MTDYDPTPDLRFSNWADEEVSLQSIRKAAVVGQAEVHGGQVRFRGDLYWLDEESVPTADLQPSIEAVQGEDPAAKRRGLENLNIVVRSHPEPVLSVVPALEPILADAPEFAPVTLELLAGLIHSHPLRVVPLCGVIADTMVNHPEPEILQPGSRCLVELAYHSPGAVIAEFDAVIDCLPAAERRATQRLFRVVRILSKVDPKRVEPALAEHFPAANRPSERARGDAVLALTNVAKADPTLGLPYFANLIDALSARVDHQTAVAETISTVTVTDPSVAIPHIPAIMAVLEDASANVRSALLPAVTSIARTNPERLLPFQDTIHAVLESEDPAVQRYGCWILGEMGDTAALDPLMKLLARSDDMAVATQVGWALREITGHSE